MRVREGAADRRSFFLFNLERNTPPALKIIIIVTQSQEFIYTGVILLQTRLDRTMHRSTSVHTEWDFLAHLVMPLYWRRSTQRCCSEEHPARVETRFYSASRNSPPKSVTHCIDEQPTNISDPVSPSGLLWNKIDGELEALPNGVFELILRTWSELCGSALQGSCGWN